MGAQDLGGPADWSLDPFQAEETELNERLKRAIALRLAGSKGGATNAVDAGNQAFDRASSYFDEMGVESQRRDLAKRAAQRHAQTFADYSPEIQRLAADPQTAATAIGFVKADEQRKRDDIEMAKFQAALHPPAPSALPGTMAATGGAAPGAPTPGWRPDINTLIGFEGSSSPKVAAAAKSMKEYYGTPRDPGHNVVWNADGTFSVVGGSKAGQEQTEGIKAQEGAKQDTVEVIMPNKEPVRMTKFDAARYAEELTARRKAAEGQAPSPPAGPTSPPPPKLGGIPEVNWNGMTPQAMGATIQQLAKERGITPQQAMAILAQSQPTTPLAPGAPDPMTLPPAPGAAQTAPLPPQQPIQGAPTPPPPPAPMPPPPQAPSAAPMPPQVAGPPPGVPQGGGAPPMPPPPQEPMGPPGPPPVPQGPEMNMPPISEMGKVTAMDFAKAQPLQRPVSQYGGAPDLTDFNKSMDARRKQLADLDPKWATLQETGPALEAMENAMKSGMSKGGVRTDVNKYWNYIVSGTSKEVPQVTNDREFDANAKMLTSGFVKRFGNNPSNYDAQIVLSMNPTTLDTASTREAFMKHLKRAYEFEKLAANEVPALVEGKGFNVPQAYDMVRGMFNSQNPLIVSEARDKFDKAQREKGSEKTSDSGNVLTNALAAINPIGSAQAAEFTPGQPPPQELPPEDSVLKRLMNVINPPQGPETKPSLFQQATSEGENKNIPSFIRGGLGAWGNSVYGLSQGADAFKEGGSFFDPSKDPKWNERIANQEKLSEEDPAYKWGNRVGSIVDPSWLGPKELKIGGNAIMGGIQGASEGAESFPERLVKIGAGGVGGAIGGALGPLLGKTVRHYGDMAAEGIADQSKRLLGVFKDFMPSAFQVDKDATSKAISAATNPAAARAPEQSQQITKTITDELGLKLPGNRLDSNTTAKVVEQAEKDTQALFPKTTKVPLDSNDRSGLVASIGKLGSEAEKSPTLALLHEALGNGTISAVKAPTLLAAWRESEKLAAGPEKRGVQDSLKTLIAKVDPDGQFDRIIGREAIAKDVEKVFNKGVGEGGASGWLKPSAIKNSGPYQSQLMKDAHDLVHLFGVKDVGEGGASFTQPSTWLHPIGGWALNKLDRTDMRASDADKAISRALRIGAQQAPIHSFLELERDRDASQ